MNSFLKGGSGQPRREKVGSNIGIVDASGLRQKNKPIEPVMVDQDNPMATMAQTEIRQKTVSHRIRMVAVIAPSDYYSTTMDHQSEFTTPVWVSFIADDGVRYAGKMTTRVDPFHFYTVVCVDIMHTRARGLAMRKILVLQSIEPIVLTVPMLATVARIHGELRDPTVFNGMTGDCKCGEVLRRFGGCAWYQRLESKFPCYFVRWYIDSLCVHSAGDVVYKQLGSDGRQTRVELPFSYRSMTAHSCATIVQLARIAATDPWRMCFWWKTDTPIPSSRDICAEGVAMIAAEFGSAELKNTLHTPEMAMIYAGAPFGDATRQGHSYISHPTFLKAVPDGAMRSAMLRAKLIETVCHCDPNTGKCVNYFAPVGMRLLEDRLISQITKITTTPDLELENVFVPVTKRWPWNGDQDVSFTPEQVEISQRLLEHRFFVLTGSAGTGKTTYVLRSLQSAFQVGKYVTCASTCVAVDILRRHNKRAVTIAKILDSFHRVDNNVDDPRYKWKKKVALIIEEASMVSVRDFSELLDALGNDRWLRYIILVGDPNQLKGMGSGPMPMRSIQKWLSGSVLAPRLTKSMRASSIALARSLESIIEYNDKHAVVPAISPDAPLSLIEMEYVPCAMQWSVDPDSDAPIVFVEHRGDLRVAAQRIYDALRRSGIDPTLPDGAYRIMMHTNELVRQFGQEWHRLTHPETIDYRADDFRVGTRIMFTTNRRAEQPIGSCLQTTNTYNGQTGTIIKIVDEEINMDELARAYVEASTARIAALEAQKHNTKIDNDGNDDEDDDDDDKEKPKESQPKDPLENIGNHRITQVMDTGAPLSYSSCIRWIVLDNDTLTTYTPGQHGEVVHAEYTTIAKSQGSEFPVSCLLLDGSPLESHVSDRHAIYTACTRAKRRCIIAIPGPIGKVCPDKHFFSIIANSTVDNEDTDMDLRFPPIDTFVSQTCISITRADLSIPLQTTSPLIPDPPQPQPSRTSPPPPPPLPSSVTPILPIDESFDETSRASVSSVGFASMLDVDETSSSTDICQMLFGDTTTEIEPQPATFKDMFNHTHKHITKRDDPVYVAHHRHHSKDKQHVHSMF